MFRKIACLLLALVISLTFFGCGSSDADKTDNADVSNDTSSDSNQTSDNSKTAADPNEEYVFVTPLASLEYWNAHKKAIQDACSELGVKASFVGDEKLDPQSMVNILETLIEKKVAGIVMQGNFPDAYAPVYEKAWEAGIPVANVTIDVPDSKRVAFLGTDYVKYGNQMGELAVEACNGKGKVIVSTFLTSGSKTVEDIIKGVREAIAKYPDVQIVAEVDDKADISVATQVIGSALQSNPDTSVIIGGQSVSATGAVTALREAGKLDQVKVISIDRDAPTLEAIKDGEIYATVAGKQYTEVYYATKFLYDYNHDKLLFCKDNKKAGVVTIPSFVDTGYVVIKKDNVDYFIDFKY